ncbi:MAG: helix-turn-helix domain-containing protein [Ruminococcus sp.]|nr:helix-turn-helix domain-containing protein [Ruminococcus sp.]
MIKFPFKLFSGSDEFPVHLQYGFHEKDDCYLHGHEDFSELVIILDGSAQHIVNSQQYEVSKGDVFVINQFTEHSFMKAEHLKICNIMFRPDDVFANVYDMKKIPGFQALFVLEPHYSQNYYFCSQLRLSAGEFPAVENMITEMMNHYSKKDTGWKDLVFSEFSLLCIMLSKLYRTDRISPGNELLKLADAAAYIENNYCSSITTEELARMTGYSERQFLRLFKAAFSAAPKLYIASLRIKKAQQLLRSTEMSIGEIAWSCGYDDHNYFSRIFKKHTGMTPSEYLRLVRK